MKKPFLFLSIIALFIAACGGQDTSTEQTTTSTPPPAVTTATISNGEALINKSDCIGCHRLDKKIIGPSYQDIAAKYAPTEENINTVADHIVNGSKGIWGQVPMTAHSKLTKDEAKEIVKYILSLKKQ